MTPLRLSCTRAITFALLMTTAVADVIILKNGEKIEGKVINQTDKDLTVSVKVSATISDERVIPRTEVERIETVQADTEAYKSIATIQTPLNSLAPTQYDARVAPLRDFLAKYPNSTHAKDTQKALDEILAEKKRVEGGEIKVRGEWITKEVAEKEKVQINGMLALEHMKSQSTSGDSIGALNTFTTLEKAYGGSASMPEAVEMARYILASMKPTLERAVDDQKAFREQKEKGFASGSPADRVQMQAAYKAEVAKADGVVAAAEKAGQWPPFLPTNEKSIKSLTARVERELSRLEKLPVGEMKASVQLTNNARKQIAEGKLEEAGPVLKEANKLWSRNELAARLDKEVAAQLKAAPKEAPVATPEPATPKPAATPRPAPPRKAAAAAPVEEPKSFFMTLPGAISIVVGIAAILAGVNVYKKMKARNSESAE